MKSIVGSLIDIVAAAPVPIGARDTLFSPVTESGGSKRRKYLSTMEKQSTVFPIVDRIATGVASAVWELFRKAPSGRPEDRERVDTHPALSVWRKPNPHYTQEEFVETMFQHYELSGEWWWILAFAEMLKGAGPPIELWPIRPDKMTPIPDKKKFISGYVYTSGRDQIPLETNTVIFNKRPNPMNPYRGMGPIGTLLIDIEGERAASKWNTQFFQNNAEPGGLIRLKENLEQTDFDTLLERWRQSHQGVSNAHRVGILEGGAEWEERQYNQRDMQFAQLRTFSRELIRQAWGFPKPLLGDVEDVNRANAEAATVIFADWLLVPRLNKLRTSLNDDFLPRFGSMGKGYEFDYVSVTPPNKSDERLDRRSNVASAVALIGQGFDPEETLEAFDLPEITFIGKGETPADDPEEPETDPEETDDA